MLVHKCLFHSMVSSQTLPGKLLFTDHYDPFESADLAYNPSGFWGIFYYIHTYLNILVLPTMM